MEVDKKEWDEFLKFQNDRKHNKVGNGANETKGDGPNNPGNNPGENPNSSGIQTKTVEFKENKPKQTTEETEEYSCGVCGYKKIYVINKFPDFCPKCGEVWR